jgi:two-component sensor histidine kinase
MSNLNIKTAAVGVIQAVSHSTSEDDLLLEIAQRWCETFDANSSDILFREPGDALLLKASTMIPSLVDRVRLGKGVGLCGQCLLSGEPIYISEDAQKDKRFAKYPGVDYTECNAIAVLPLKNEAGHTFGTILIRCGEVWKFRKSERAALEELSEVTSASILAFQAAYRAGTQSNRLGALSEVSKTIAQSPYLEEILQLLVNLTAQQFNYRVCTVRLLDEERGVLVLRATQAPAKAYHRKRAIRLGESIAGRVMAQNHAAIVRDVQTEEDYIGHDLAVEQGLRSMICVPLTIQDKAVGVLSCYTSEVRDFLPDEQKALETLAKQAAFSIEHAKLQVRTTLMQEMHHRVKNNLQQVASLLRLQMSMSRYTSLEVALNDTLSRILAIASVHDLLSREDLDHVGIRSIAETLVHHQQSSLLSPDRSIKFVVTGDDVTLSMNQATQVALVLNELIMNAIEHGFSTVRSGEVHINMEAPGDDVSIWVSNDGDRLPEGFNPLESSNLGLKIVENLSRSLGGRFRLDDRLGWTVAEVKFVKASSSE